MRANRAASKGRAVSDGEILVGSIHGSWSPYEGPTPGCTTGDTNDRPDVPIACSSAAFGTATSGDRYERFMRQFPNYYPNAASGGSEATRTDFDNVKEAGEICAGDLSDVMRGVGESFASLAAP